MLRYTSESCCIQPLSKANSLTGLCIFAGRYPNSVKLIRTYANFLENVKNNPWAAARFYSLADKQEEEQEALANDAVADDGKGGVIDTKGQAVITINATGVILTVNKAANTMFGYSRYLSNQVS